MDWLYTTAATAVASDFHSAATIPEEDEEMGLARFLPTCPEVVIVGAQSAGKTSLLSRMLDLPDSLLTVGQTFSTVCPTRITILHSNDESVSVGCEELGEMYRYDGISLTAQTADAIREQIEELSRHIVEAERVGNPHPLAIDITIMSKHQKPISILDLPGIVARDRPGDERASAERLFELSRRYCDSPRVVRIFAAVTARADVEVDLVWTLLRQVDPQGKRTSIVLTKVDLLPASAVEVVQAMLDGKEGIPVSHGYYATGERLPEALQSHPNVGVVPIRATVTQVIRDALVSSRTEIVESLTSHVSHTTQELAKMGHGGGDEDQEGGSESASSSSLAAAASSLATLALLLNRISQRFRVALTGTGVADVLSGGTALQRVVQGILCDDCEREGGGRRGKPLLRVVDDDEKGIGIISGLHLPHLDAVARLEHAVQASHVKEHFYQKGSTAVRQSGKVVRELACQLFQDATPTRPRLREALSSRVEACIGHCAEQALSHATRCIDAELCHVCTPSAALKRHLEQGQLELASRLYEEEICTTLGRAVARSTVFHFVFVFLNQLEAAFTELLDSEGAEALLAEDETLVAQRCRLRRRLRGLKAALRVAQKL